MCLYCILYSKLSYVSNINFFSLLSVYNMSAPPKPWQLRRRPYTDAETTGGTGRDNNARYSPRHSPPSASSAAPGGQQQQQLGTPRGLPSTNRPQQAPLPPPRGPSVYGGGKMSKKNGKNTPIRAQARSYSSGIHSVLFELQA